jgi:photosystem II stability/assembly factor-like uncharacterized protein
MKTIFYLAASLFTVTSFAQDWTTIHDFGSQTSQGIMWIDAETVWACTAIYGGQPLQAKKSTDGGDTWESQNTGLPGGSAGNMRDVASPDSVDIFMIGNEGNLIRNGGDDTWEIVNLGTTLPLRTIQFASASVGYIGSDEGHFYKTTDGGNNWEDIGLPEVASVNAMYFITEDKGFVYTYGAGIYRTLDGAATFEYMPFDQPLSVFSNGIRDMTFVDENLGFAVGTNEVVMKTTDGGDNWDFIPMGTTNTMQGVDFANATTGFAVGWNATVIWTIDGGESWELMTTDTPTDVELFHDVDFFENHGLLTTNSGYVLAFDLDIVAGCTDALACNYNPAATSDDGSCEFVETYNIVGPLVVSASSQEGYAYSSSAGSTYFWEVGGGTIGSGQGFSTITVNWGGPGIGVLTVTETNADGCLGAPVTVEVAIDPTNVSEWEVFPWSVYPNPSFGMITFESKNARRPIEHIFLYNLQGELVDQIVPVDSGMSIWRWDASHLAAGHYSVQILSGNQYYRTSLVLCE